MKTRFFKILIPVLIIVFAAFGAQNKLFPTTAFAVGDLTVNWGVPEGNPIFVISNMAPGNVESRNVDITNNALALKPVSVRGIKTSESGNLSTMLDIVILDGVNLLYGPVSLSQFFTDAGAVNGIHLFDLAPSGSKTITFKVTFNSSAGNAFQGRQVVFDLKIGIASDIPAECQGIEFSGNPIYGTDKSENIHGTPGNDLIFGFGGNDKIEGESGDDCIVGGSGNDRLIGNSDNDVLLGGGGNDYLEGNNGNDKLYGENGNDDLEGSNGDDQLFGGNGRDNLKGENGNDLLNGGPDDDSVDGGNGNDNMDGGGGLNDFGNGRNGTDTCINFQFKQGCEL